MDELKRIGPAPAEHHHLWSAVQKFLKTIPLAALLRAPWRCLNQQQENTEKTNTVEQMFHRDNRGQS